jgi:hypothetical protein
VEGGVKYDGSDNNRIDNLTQISFNGNLLTTNGVLYLASDNNIITGGVKIHNNHRDGVVYD